ncbi:MAG TPA: histidine kinase dimerization/phospho-acceptor domain-containing protein [Longimicrobiales bacterium]|nr:histidine kinase dimerization/phospho-acceptor domain-containing protein [Longimicrobiales bacterium]
MDVESELSRITEDQLRANRFALVSRLADDLAHEIKNPLNSIVINLEVLKVRVAKGDADGAIERAGVIEHEVRRLHALVERLLQLIRPERDEATSLPLEAALDELLPLLEAQTRLARNEFVADCQTSAFVAVRRDVFRFAVLNLLTAVHECLGEGGGTLSVRCSKEDDVVAVVVQATTGADAPPLRPPGAEFDEALAIAAALLHPCGATVDRRPGGVAIRLPRAAPV